MSDIQTKRSDLQQHFKRNLVQSLVKRSQILEKISRSDDEINQHKATDCQENSVPSDSTENNSMTSDNHTRSLFSNEEQSFLICVKIFELRELFGFYVNPFVEVAIGEEVLELPPQGTSTPKWNEFHCFSIKKSPHELMQTIIEFSVMNSNVNNLLIGSFRCELGYIYNCKNHMVHEKWLPLQNGTSATDFVDGDGKFTDIRGYLKVRILEISELADQLRNIQKNSLMLEVEIVFRIISVHRSKTGKKKTILAVAKLNLSKIYQWRSSEIVTTVHNNKFVGRLLLTIRCTDDLCRKTSKKFIHSRDLRLAESRLPRLFCQYVLCSTFFDANFIHPSLRGKNICFVASIGHYGNDLHTGVTNFANRTLAMIKMLSECAETIEGESCSALEASSNVVETMEDLCLILHLLTESEIWEESHLMNIDCFHLDLIKTLLSMVAENFWNVKFNKIDYKHLKQIAYDCKEYYCGIYCGQQRLISLKWLENDRLEDKNSIAGCVNLRAWFGKNENRMIWEKTTKPGRIWYCAEIFENQYLLSKDNWREATGSNGEPFPQSDESGFVAIAKNICLPPGWSYGGPWKLLFCHDMWVGPDAGRLKYEEEFYEMEKKVDNRWITTEYINAYGEVVHNVFDQVTPRGWKWSGLWAIDLFCAGDVHGWTYSIDKNFMGHKSLMDYTEREEHNYRRRRWRRIRIRDDDSVFENLAAFKCTIDPDSWEYARVFGEPVHMQKMSNDRFRRRRYVREIVPPKDIHLRQEYSCATKWQMHATLIWSKNLKESAPGILKTFVRIAFTNCCQRTSTVEESNNPIWDETLIFDKISSSIIHSILFQVILCGSSLLQNPPRIIVEICSEHFDGSEKLIGYFVTVPHVSYSSMSRAKPSWHSFRLGNIKIGTALLASFELFPYELGSIFSRMAKLKPNSIRYLASSAISPRLKKYHWFAGNFFVELRVGDRSIRSDAIENPEKNPNFSRNLLVLTDVLLPENLKYAPPLNIILYETYSFGRQLEIGRSIIMDYQCICTNYFLKKFPYLLNFISINFIKLTDKFFPQKSKAYNWKKFNEMTQAEDIFEKNFSENLTGDYELIDWWSKYYSSIGELARAPNFPASNIGTLKVYDCALEEVDEFHGFRDFADTFIFQKSHDVFQKLGKNQIECGELKGKVFIKEEGSVKRDMQLICKEFTSVTKCVVRVYIIRAFNLVFPKNDGRYNPYISIKCGKRKRHIVTKKRKYGFGENPIFGQMIELEANLPLEKDLIIRVMNRNRLFTDDEIGQTTIDLENRLLTLHRGTIGLPKQYIARGPLTWRDQLTPLKLLKQSIKKCISRQCIKMGYPPPEMETKVDDIGLTVAGITFWCKNIEKASSNLELMGNALQRVALFVLNQMGLVPEHVETRPLHSGNNKVNNKVEYGKLQLFVDIMPIILGPIPPPLDISPRLPKKYELRVVVWNVRNFKNVKLKAADLYVKCFLYGSTKRECTDIHYRSTDGYGTFNWRFILKFDFDIWEQKLIHYKKRRLFGFESMKIITTKVMMEPILVVEIWDNNKFEKDDYIGQLKFNLLAFDEAQMESEEMLNVYPAQAGNRCMLLKKILSCLYLSDYTTRTLPDRRYDRLRLKKMLSVWRDILLMNNEKCLRPNEHLLYGDITNFLSYHKAILVANLVPTSNAFETRINRTVQKGKDDDPEQRIPYVTGLVELEMELLVAEEAKKEPVGKKRNKPNHSPFLPVPVRRRYDEFWLSSRLAEFSRIFWRKYGRRCVCRVLLALFIFFFIVTFVFHLPHILFKI
ncbi:unnamed protein product [Dracunculus medinensis]|uniref:C2 domain-containing protein n=1 Tax=Dracunculus medinensis TaxID=318479 RepID=A0A0N4UPW9_DRAME|nr:unnamed protein product [Dracunculus medinensis]